VKAMATCLAGVMRSSPVEDHGVRDIDHQHGSAGRSLFGLKHFEVFFLHVKSEFTERVIELNSELVKSDIAGIVAELDSRFSGRVLQSCAFVRQRVVTLAAGFHSFEDLIEGILAQAAFALGR